MDPPLRQPRWILSAVVCLSVVIKQTTPMSDGLSAILKFHNATVPNSGSLDAYPPPIAVKTVGSVATTSSTSASSSSRPSSISNALATTSAPPSGGKLFYMYPLGGDEKYWWRWPDPKSDCTKNKYVQHTHGELSGVGPPLNLNDGLFLTWHFSIFHAFWNRLKRSKWRTTDPDKASLFVVPYDMAMDGYVEPRTCNNKIMNLRCSPGYVSEVQQILKHSKHFKRHRGADHVILWSLHQYHKLPRAGCDHFMMNFCQRCTFTCYWMNYTKVDNNFISVPFPSAYHWWDGIKNLPWDLNLVPKRNMTAVYVGSTRTITPDHTKIRQAMTAQCTTRDGCHWLKIFHSSTDHRIPDLLGAYKFGTFCLCPPGDDPGRKAVFDSIVSGCIPVVFHESTIFNQYPWHLGEQLAQDISVFIPGMDVVSGKLKVMQILKAIKPDVIKKKQQLLELLAPRIQYAIPPIELLKNRSDETPWDPPFKDAVEVALEGMFDRAHRAVNNQPTLIPRVMLTEQGWRDRYKQVLVAVPNLENYRDWPKVPIGPKA